VSEVLKRIFGEDFQERYQRALARAQQIPSEELEAIKRFAVEALKSSEDFRVRYGDFDVILAQTPAEPGKFPILRASTGYYKVAMLWPGSKSIRGPLVSVFTADRSTAEKLSSTPNKAWLLVGRLQERRWQGDVAYIFRLRGVIPLD